MVLYVVSELNFEPRVIQTLLHDKQVRLWRAKYISDEAVTCSHVTRFDDSDSETLSDIYAVSIQSNTEIFVAGSLSGFAHLVNVKTGKRVARLEGHTAAVTDLCFCRETSNLVVTSSNDTTVCHTLEQKSSPYLITRCFQINTSGTPLGCSQRFMYTKNTPRRGDYICLVKRKLSCYVIIGQLASYMGCTNLSIFESSHRTRKHVEKIRSCSVWNS